MPKIAVPTHLYHSREWRALIHCFTECWKLQRYFTTEYFDLDNATVRVQALKRVSAPWSQSEKFMLKLALHLFNGTNKAPDLYGMDYLDENNTRIAFEALAIRYGKGLKV